MKPYLGAESIIKVGVEVVIESDSPDKTRGVVFEDDGTTGFFYARDHTQTEHLWVDALHIYDVDGVVDRDKPSKIKILWTRDFDAAALLVNLRPHAIFHFGRCCGYADEPFPDNSMAPGWAHAKLEPSLQSLFFPEST